MNTTTTGTRRSGYLPWQKWLIIFVVGFLLPIFGVRVRAQAAAWSHTSSPASIHTGSGIEGDDDDGSDDSDDDHGSDDHGSDDHGSDDHGSDDSGSDDHGSDDSGDDSSDDHGSDDGSSHDSGDDHGSDSGDDSSNDHGSDDGSNHDSGDDSSDDRSSDDRSSDDRSDDSSNSPDDDGTPDQGSGDTAGTGTSVDDDDGTPDQGSGDASGSMPGTSSNTQRNRGGRSAEAVEQMGTVNAMPASGRQGVWRIDGKVFLVTRHTEVTSTAGATSVMLGQCVKLRIVPGTSSVVRSIEAETTEHCAAAATPAL